MELKKHTCELENTTGKLEIDYLPSVNYVLNVNNVAVFDKLTLTNDEESAWHDVEISVSGPLLLDSSLKIESLTAGQTIDLTKEISVKANPQKLAELTESDSSFFTVRVSVEGREILCREFPLQIQTYDQWAGPAFRPELLAAFVTPNHPLISGIIGNAREALKRMTGTDSFDAYQTNDVNRVRCQVAAVYEALRAEGLSYVTPPASFESGGQRVRPVDKVLEEKMGTCLDLSLLYASCLEAIGLNPILLLSKGHCFVGCWLVRDSYQQSVGDDPDYILKRVSDGISEMVVMEATSLTGSAPISFEQSCGMATARLNKESEFECFIDVGQARVNNVRPIPLRVRQDDGSWQIVNEGTSHDAHAGNLKVMDRYDLSAYDANPSEVTKYTVWERKLLDFSLRNSLLNIRSGRRVIPLLTFAIDDLENLLQEGKGFNVRPFPLDEVPVPGERGIYESSVYSSVEEYVREEMEKRLLYSFLRDEALYDGLKYVYRASRTSMEENGANNLYLVLGLLKWYETELAKDPHFAPLLLLPIEIVRTLGGGGYTIRARDEGISLNITLIELLRQQHGIDLSALSELPEDGQGLDVKKIMAVIRDKIRDKKGWNVLDESLIGIFSFNKFVMWNDIHTNSDKLSGHEIISSLVDGKLNMDADSLEAVDVKSFDLEKRPADYAIPIDVDSSQLEAIIASGEGRSFILHGPPGTGKSQTITNIIANALYQGKRVLFVAEKMAALEVVRDRLSKIGLSPFCLELHSNKATKQHFLKQMDEALDVVRRGGATGYEALSDKVFDKRMEIIGYAEALHAKDRSGFSLYECIERYFPVADCEDPVKFDEEVLSDFTPEKMEESIERVRELNPVLQIIGNPAHHPLSSMRVDENFDEAERQIARNVPEAAALMNEFEALSARFREIWGFGAPDFHCGDEELQAFNAFLGAPLLTEELVLLTLSPDKLPSLFGALSVGEASVRKRHQLAETYSENYLDLDTSALKTQWMDVERKWFLPRFFARRKFIRNLPVSKTRIEAEHVVGLLDELAETNRKYSDFNSHDSGLFRVFGREATTVVECRKMWSSLELVMEMTHMRTLVFRNPDKVLPKEENTRKIADVAPGMSREDLEEAISLNEKILETNGKIRLHMNEFSGCLSHKSDNLDNLTKIWAGNIRKLKDWIFFRRQLRELTDFIGVDLWSQLSHENAVRHAVAALQKGFYEAKARKMIDSNPALRYFRGILFDDTIERYRKLTSQLQEMSKKALYHRLASNLPSMSMMAHDTSELGILKRSIKSGGRGKSIRSIIDLVPTILPKLCPCMLMSPISVAQYISLDTPKFDIVIFDEASQMPTSEAVGAIARGKSLIVVGDPKQMPPTSFFSTSAVGEDEVHIDDMESILDDCIAMSVPSKYLTWHYRSKHESLITFSNRQYYNGKLITFPSVDNLSSKVTLRHVDGVYDRSRSRCNQIEAEAVVKEVIRRLSNPVLSRKSIGIVAFSKVQQDRIEDILTTELAGNPQLESLAFGGPEPVFVKNLENVQGDERDVILFSVGYGPDKNGKVSMNFGPLNISGGERRLNVAVSRARYEMVVFSSLHPDQIDLRRSGSAGVAGLKHFLEYASTGTMPGISVDGETSATNNDHVQTKLRQIVEEAGYDFDLNVGSSNFKVDIAIKDPEEPDKYILGLLLDGPAYYATKTVRDREIVQPTVLKLLGWNVVKVWTLDLINRPGDVLKMIKLRMHTLLENKERESATKMISAENVVDSEEEEFEELAVESAVPSHSETIESRRSIPYPKVPPYKGRKLDDPDHLYSYFTEVCDIAKKVVAVESPVTSSLVCKRVVKAFGLNKVVPKVEMAVKDVMTKLKVFSRPNGKHGRVYWAKRGEAYSYDKYRVDSGREITDIPIMEIENAMMYVLSQQIALDIDGLKRLTANELGFTRMKAGIDETMTEVLARLRKRDLLRFDGKKVTL